MKNLTILSLTAIAFVLSLTIFAPKAEAASTSVNVPPYGIVYVTANHYGNKGNWDAQGTNNLMSNPTGIAMAAINAGGNYSYNYSCGNRDVVSAYCAGGPSCYQGDMYNVSTGCALTKTEECSNGCTNAGCNIPPPGSPSTPTNLVAATSDVCGSRIRLTWTASNLATGYKIYRSTTANGTYTLINTTPTTLTDYTDTPGQGTYFYKVKATNAVSDSLFSNMSSAAASAYCPPISTPGGASITTAEICGGRVAVSWNSVAAAGGYNVYRWATDLSSSYNSYHANYVSYSRSNNNYPYYFDYYGYRNGLITPNGTTTTSFTDSPGQGTFYYSVAAYPSAGANKTDMGRLLQPAIRVTSSQRCPPPPTPTNLRAQTSLSCGGKARLTWDRSAGAENYFLMRSTTLNGAQTEVGPISGSATFFTDTPGTGTFFYRIIAETGGERSPASSAQEATTSGVCPPNAPIGITFRANPSYINKGQTCNLEWTVSNSDSCKITATNGDELSFDPNEQETFRTRPLESRTIYTITCTNGDETISKNATCNINPTLNER